MTTVTVLTPTIATQTLANAVKSVANQKVAHDIEIRHVVVADGKRYENSARDISIKAWEGTGAIARVSSIPDNTGANGWNGHKIYAHYAQLLDSDYICLLDEDNTFEPNHIASLLPIAEEHGYAWSMRNVQSITGEPYGIDTKESIGTWVEPSEGDPYILVDTSCWMLRRSHVKHLIHFLQPWCGDRTFTAYMHSIANNLAPMCSGIATMNYTAPDRLQTFFKNICTKD
jgi:hypothetical protein